MEYGEIDNAKSKKRVYLDSLSMVLLAVFLADTATLIIYGSMPGANLAFELGITASITIVVATPIALCVFGQKQKLQLLSEKLAHVAQIDQMSGLLNRTAFLSAVNDMLHTPPSGPTAGSFLFIDVDHFKRINDIFGHSVGDDVIKAIAETIKDGAPDKALVGRIGGEEFGLFLPHANKKVAQTVAENIRRKVRKLIFEKDKDLYQMSVSIGGSLHQAGQTLSSFVQHADKRMYLAKSRGRNRAVFESEETSIAPSSGIKKTA